MKLCKSCNQELPLEAFHNRSRAKDGKQSVCKDCNCAQRKAYYQTAHGRKNDDANAKRSFVAIRNYILAYLRDHPCVDCSNDDVRVLEFDHVRGTKTFGIAAGMRRGYGWQRIKDEIAKCDVRCANCHRIRTHELSGSYRCR